MNYVKTIVRLRLCGCGNSPHSQSIAAELGARSSVVGIRYAWSAIQRSYGPRERLLSSRSRTARRQLKKAARGGNGAKTKDGTLTDTLMNKTFADSRPRRIAGSNANPTGARMRERKPEPIGVRIPTRQPAAPLTPF
jgi:hypothetical protein